MENLFHFGGGRNLEFRKLEDSRVLGGGGFFLQDFFDLFGGASGFWFGAGQKIFFFGVGTTSTGKCPGQRADTRFNYFLGLNELFNWLVFQNIVHNFPPY